MENLEAAFPADRYIAVRSTSGSRETLEQAALNALSLYFQALVSSRTDLAESYAEQNGEVSQSLQLEQQTVVQTETELFAVRYTDPWRNVNGIWEMAAYIDRDEAWALFEPRLTSKTAPFMAIVKAAEKDIEPLRRFFRYRAARSLDPAALPAYLDFARTLNPGRAAAFNPVREASAALSLRLDEAKFEASVCLDIPVDMDGIAAAALISALSAEGFPITENRNAAGAVCRAVIDEGRENREGGTFYTPKLTLTLQGKADPLFSMTLEAPRQSAVNPDIARRRAYAALAGEIQSQFHGEFEKQMSVVIN
ncbi:MAG: hypothetical protein LBP80_04320 [Treponema sp.]|nr:hypothetical protein [Treponema sp.]